MSKVLKIVIGSHFFKVVNPTPRALPCILKFCSSYSLFQWVKVGRKKSVYKPTKVFGTRTKDNREFRFHIGQLDDFITSLNKDYITTDMYSIEYLDYYEPVLINAKVVPNIELKDFQSRAKSFIMEDSVYDCKSRLLSFQTGSGKTITSLYTSVEIGKRTLIVILASYLDKWIEDVEKTLVCKPKDIMTVQGSNQLKNLIDLALADELQAEYIIVSLNTIKNFFKSYELNPSGIQYEGYNCLPEDLCRVLKVGTIIIDEVHQHIHAVFKFLTYTHVDKVIGLSATLLSDNPTIQKMHKLMFPKEIRFDGKALNKYIKCYAVSYQLDDIRRTGIRTTEHGSNVYSHTAFEKSIIRNKKLLKSYINLVNYLVDVGYIEEYRKGDKLIIFVSTITLATLITNFLKSQYPNFDVRRYVEQDPYENVIDADIRVTTILSAGTAIDIPGLVTSIMTNNIKSSVFNIQTLGRLREIPGRNVKFYYTYCDQLPKHSEYHHWRMDLYKDRVASIKELTYPFAL